MLHAQMCAISLPLFPPRTSHVPTRRSIRQVYTHTQPPTHSTCPALARLNTPPSTLHLFFSSLVLMSNMWRMLCRGHMPLSSFCTSCFSVSVRCRWCVSPLAVGCWVSLHVCCCRVHTIGGLVSMYVWDTLPLHPPCTFFLLRYKRTRTNTHTHNPTPPPLSHLRPPKKRMGKGRGVGMVG